MWPKPLIRRAEEFDLAAPYRLARAILVYRGVLASTAEAASWLSGDVAPEGAQLEALISILHVGADRAAVWRSLVYAC